jgi:hypothetical protein
MDKHQNADLNNQEYRATSMHEMVPYSTRIPRRKMLPSSGGRAFGVTLGLVGILAAGWLVVPGQVQWPLALTPPVRSDTFRRAVNRAMSAAELTQTAATEEEWKTVVQWWEEAIDLMAAVSPGNSNYALAQDKVGEYSQNLAYARQRMNRPDPAQSASKALWSTGSAREQVIRAQGEPSRSVRYDPLCQEVLYYGNSTVELTNGTVSDYRDVDGKFRVSAQPPETRLIASNGTAWTIGSSKDDVFQIQGTPSRVDRHDLPNVDVLYYGSSSVTLVNDQVVGYNNLGNNLKLSVEAIATPTEYLNQQAWQLGSLRGDVLRLQGVPNQITSDGLSCSEVLVYNGSKVELRNGSVSAYDNVAGNLRVSVE